MNLGSNFIHELGGILNQSSLSSVSQMDLSKNNLKDAGIENLIQILNDQDIVHVDISNN
jgi:hypothetical protein